MWCVAVSELATQCRARLSHNAAAADDDDDHDGTDGG